MSTLSGPIWAGLIRTVVATLLVNDYNPEPSEYGDSAFSDGPTSWPAGARIAARADVDGRQRRHVAAESARMRTAIVDIVADVAIARLPLIVIDCPDPGALARFYGAMLDWKTDVSADRAAVCAESGQCISFHKVADYTPPMWPTQEWPQQMHLDVIVDDLDAAEAAVIDLGASKHADQPGTSYRVFLDPAGHPFCLCLN